MAHEDRSPPAQNPIRRDVTTARELTLRFIELAEACIDGGSGGHVRDGTYAVGNSDYPQRDLETLFQILFRSRASALPAGYELIRHGKHGPGRSWSLRREGKFMNHLQFLDPEKAALTAWLHSVDRVPAEWILSGSTFDLDVGDDDE